MNKQLIDLIDRAIYFDQSGYYKLSDKILGKMMIKLSQYDLSDSPKDYPYHRGEEDEYDDLYTLISVLWTMIERDPDWDDMDTYEDLVNRYNTSNPVLKIDTESIITGIWDAQKKGWDIGMVMHKWGQMISEEYKD
jgi:hypothetical protein